MPYHLIREDTDTRIHHVVQGEYATYEEARQAAIDYLQHLVIGCQDRLDELEDSRTAKQYFGCQALNPEN